MDPSSFLSLFGGDDARAPSSATSTSSPRPSTFPSTDHHLPPEVLRWYQEQQLQPQAGLDHGPHTFSSAVSSGSPAFAHHSAQDAGQGASKAGYAFDVSPSQEAIQKSSVGPMRQKTKEISSIPSVASSKPISDDAGTSPSSSKATAASATSKAAPVRAACLFCRARKSRCNGQHPCHNCINRGREDDCIYTVSRRGGKPKPKANQSQEDANLEQHLKRLFALSQLPQQIRIPGAIPQLIEAQKGQEPEANASDMQKYVQQSSQPSGLPQYSRQMPQDQSQPSDMPHTDHHMVDSQSPFSAPLDALAAFNPLGQDNQSGGSNWDPMMSLYSTMNQSYGHNPPLSAFNGSPAGATYPQSADYPSMSLQHQQLHQLQPTTTSSDWSQQQNLAPETQSTLHHVPTASVESSSPLPASSTVYTILLGYYNSLYRFLPVFAPPQYIHEMSQKLSVESPFILALQAILPLLQDGDRLTANSKIGSGDSDASNHSFAAGFGIGPGNGGLKFPTPERKAELIAITSYYERKATETIEIVLERAEDQLQGSSQPLTDQGTMLGVIQALAVLCVYHYGSGRALKARLKADQALGLAMAKGLHRLKKPDSRSPSRPASKSSFISTDDPFGSQSLYSDLPLAVRYEMEKRIWWTCWSSSLWCSYNTAIAPTIRADDPRVITEMPSSRDPTVWMANIRSLQSLLSIQERVLALATFKDGDDQDMEARIAAKEDGLVFSPSRSAYALSSHGRGDTPTGEQAITFTSLPSNASRQDVLDSMLDIDRSLQEQIEQIEADEEGFKRLCQEPSSVGSQNEEALNRVEDDLEMYLKRSASIQLYTSSLTLHLGQAFQGAALFERKLCFLNTVTENDTSAVCQVPMPDSFSTVFGNDQMPNGGDEDSSDQATSDAAHPTARNRVTATQDLFARGPFLPKDSLRRCVHASKRLLEIARSKRKEPNPFNACSLLLIAFTLLMQALAVSSASTDDEDESEAEPQDGEDFDGEEGDDDMSDPIGATDPQRENSLWSGSNDRGASQAVVDVSAFSRGLLQSAQGAAALSGSGQTPFEGTQASQQPPWDLSAGVGSDNGEIAGHDRTRGGEVSTAALRRREKLTEIWNRVAEAHATLKELGAYWKMVEPMADEVSLCLETSQLLLQQ